MSLIGLDLNSSRARAVAGPRSQALSQLCLDGAEVELLLAVNLAEKRPVVGRSGLGLVRRRPHQACIDFLPHLTGTRLYGSPPHTLTADKATQLFLQVLTRALGRIVGTTIAVPPYLHEAQLVQFYRLAEQAGLRLLGSVPAPLAAAQASLAETDRLDVVAGGLILVVDLDGHALTWSVVEVEHRQLQLRTVQPSAHLGRGAWLKKLIDGVALRCVRQSRRDPRESGETEQRLYDQLLASLASSERGLVQLNVQGEGWFHHLMLHEEDLVAFTAPLLRQVRAELDILLPALASMGPLAGAVITPAVASLPGLMPLLTAHLEQVVALAPPMEEEDEDFGEGMMRKLAGPARVLDASAIAGAAHELALHIHRGEIRPGHQQALLRPLKPGTPEMDNGPARLNFRGTDHLLTTSPFSMGRDPSCNLVFETDLFPHVSTRHAEVIFDRKSYTLCDRSRHGTLLNDRPINQQSALHSGDWIRLGPKGPAIRFLGQAAQTSSEPASQRR